MFDCFSYLAFIAPGGPELIVIMLVLLMMFGAKDAPRILRKLNDLFNQIRNTADGFKREVMYSDLKNEDSTFDPPDTTDEPEAYDADYSDYAEDDGDDGVVEEAPEPDLETTTPEGEDDDVQKA